MIKICFVCLGNICRSPMAEYIMKSKLRKPNMENLISVVSRATSYEEQGNDIYHLAKEKLIEKCIPFQKHKSTRLEEDDYDKFDYFICMEQKNIANALRIFGSDHKNKISTLLKTDIADPWYTGNFEETYIDLDNGINHLISKLQEK